MLPSTARLLRLRDLGGQGWLSSRLLRGFHSIRFALAAHREHGIRPENVARKSANQMRFGGNLHGVLGCVLDPKQS